MGTVLITIRILVGLMIANIVTMAVMNLFQLTPNLLPVVYVGALIVGFITTPKLHLETAWAMTPKQRRISQLLALFFIFGIGLVRAPYILEGIFQQISFGVTGDDAWHIQEMVSLTQSPQFPPLYGVFQRDYMLFYYAPWMMIAALKLAFPTIIPSLKVAYGAGYFLYIALVVPIIFGLIRSESRSSRQYWALIFLLLIHAGMQSFNALSFPFTSHENWMGHYKIYVQFSSFSTLLLWVIHHVLAAVSLILAYQYATVTWTNPITRWRAIITVGWLGAFAIMASPFVCLGAIALGGFALIYHRQWVIRGGWVAGLWMQIWVLPMLWMYLQKQSDFRWFFNILNLLPSQFKIANGVISLLIFTLLIIMEFLVPFAILIRIRRHGLRLMQTDKVLLSISVFMIFSTFFVGYGIYNNYAMRATILPVAFGLVALSRYIDQLPPIQGKKMRVWVGFWLVIMSIGSLNEIGAVWKQSYRELRLMTTQQYTRTMMGYATVFL